MSVARLFLLAAVFSTVVAYSVVPEDQRQTAIRFLQPIYEMEEPSELDGRLKRGLDDIEQQLSKRTNLKRLVILSARGFGKK